MGNPKPSNAKQKPNHRATMRLVLIFFGLLAGNCAMNITGSAFPRETNVGCLIERTLLDALVVFALV